MQTLAFHGQASSSLVTGVQTPPSLKRRVTHQLSPAVTPSSGMSKLAVSRPAVVAAAVIPRASSLPEQHSASSSGTRLNNGNAGGAASAAAATAAGGAAASAGAAGPAQNAAVALMAHQGQSSSPSPSPRTPLQPLQPLILKVPDNAAILRNHLEQSADEAFLSPTNLELNGRSQHTLFSLLPQPVEENGTPQTPSPKSSPAPQWTVSEQQSATKASRRPQSPAVAAGAQRTRIFSNLSQPSFQQSSLGSPAPPEAPTTQPMVMLHETPMSKMTVLSGRQLSGRSFKITGANTSPVASPTSSNPFSQGPAASAAPPQAPVLHHQSPQPSGLLGPSFPSVPEQQPIQALAAAAAAAAPAPQMSWQEAVALATAIYQQRPQQGQQGDGAVVASPGGSAAPMGSLQALGAFAETQMMAQQQQQQQPQQQQQQYQQQYQPQQQQQQYQPQQQQQQQQYQPQQQQQLQQQQHQQQQQQQQQQYQLRQQQQQQQLQYQLQFQQQQQPQQQQQQQQQGMAPLQAATPMGSLQTLGDFARASGGSQGNTALLVSAAARELPPKQISAIGSVITQAMQGGTLLQQQQQHLQQSPHSAAVTAAVAAASSATPPWPVATVGEQQVSVTDTPACLTMSAVVTATSCSERPSWSPVAS